MFSTKYLFFFVKYYFPLKIRHAFVINTLHTTTQLNLKKSQNQNFTAMISLNTRLFYRVLCLFCCLLLRGPVTGNSEPKKSQAEILKEVEGKTAMEVLTTANSYSYKDLNLSLFYANIALEKAQKANDTRTLFDVQRAIGFIYEDNTMVQKAIETYENAIKTAEILGDTALSSVYNDLAIVNRKITNFKASYNYYDKTIYHAQRIKDTAMMASSYHGWGQLYKEVGIYDRAIEYFLKSLTLSEQTNSTIDVIVSHNDISDAYLRAKESETALQHVEKAYRLAQSYYKTYPEQEDAVMQLASVINRYGNILLERKNYAQALSKYEEALAIYKNLSYKLYIARCLMYIANVYVLQNDFINAEIKFKECLKYEKLFLKPDLSELYLKIGTFYTQRKLPQEAEEAFKKSLDISNKYDLKEYAQKVSYQMFLLYLEKHENTKALDYLKLSNALNDSLYNAAKTKRTAEIEFKFDIEKKENELQSFKLRANEADLRGNKLLFMASLILFAMIVIFLIYSMHTRGKNLKALQQKNEEVELQYRKLEESNEILSQFAYAAAHDLKEPLRSIGSYIGLIQMKHGKILPDDAKEYMTFVNNGVKRMYSLLTDLLDFSQVISQQPGNDEVRPNDILMDVEDNLRSAIEAKNAQIVYQKNLPSVQMNRLHMTQLFQNLIGNALKFTEKPPVVKVNAVEENGNLILTIEDNGIGIKKDYSSKIFVLFQQLNKKGQFEGTGIGLTICKNIVEKYNGKIWFESEENIGTKFYISLPMQAQAA
jgi:signal transduction histidine kinase